MYWLMIVKDHRAGRREIVPAMRVLLTRVKYGFWLLSAKSPYRKKIQVGDSGLFYVSSKMGRVLAGTCQITSELRPITQSIKSLVEGYPSSLLTHYVGIQGLIWTNPVNAADVIPNMSFVKNKQRWYAYLQGSLHPITREDFELALKVESEKRVVTEEDKV